MPLAQDIPIDVGSNRQLLFVELYVNKDKGVKLTQNAPYQVPEPVLVAEKPWENGGLCAYNTVTIGDGRFRMWYESFACDDHNHRRRLLCYAESGNGVNWEKPEIGLISFNGSKGNNIVAPPSTVCSDPENDEEELGAWVGQPSMQGGTVFRDEHAPDAERYKLWTKYQASTENTKNGINTGLWAMVSRDGFEWKLMDQGYPLSKGNAADTQSCPFWDEDKKIRSFRPYQEISQEPTAYLFSRYHVFR